MYQNYIFDFYGTLADIRTEEEDPWLWEKVSDIYSAMGASYSSHELQRAFRRMEKEEKKRAVVSQETEALRAEYQEDMEPDLTKVFLRLYEEKGVDCSPLQAKMTAITFRALSRKYLRVYDGVEELLGELRRRGKKIYLLSNAQSDFTRPEIDMLGLTKYFDGIFLSSEQGWKKPSPIFFSKLLDKYQLKPSESIMIGNDEAADIVGAQSVGMDALYIHTAISPLEYGRVEADYRVMDGDFRKIGKLILG